MSVFRLLFIMTHCDRFAFTRLMNVSNWLRSPLNVVWATKSFMRPQRILNALTPVLEMSTLDWMFENSSNLWWLKSGGTNSRVRSSNSSNIGAAALLCLGSYTSMSTHTKLTRRDNVEKVFKFIHPDFCQAAVVFVDDLSCPSWKRVGRRLSEHMTHMRACDNLQSPTTLPNL